jgi:hypothetical protein
MLSLENKIAQAEYVAYEAKLNRPVTEGVTVQVPNVIDRVLMALRNALTRRAEETAQPRSSGSYIRGVPAK